ncbi:hypothetical protein XANCAGTX0491_000793 [Xanthoria calcicola]
MKLTNFLFLPSLFFPLPSRANVIVSCFEDSSPPMIPTTYHACFQVIKFIISHERIELPTLFSRAPNVGYRLPEQWRQGSCVLQLDMNDAATAPAETETATFKNVADAAASVILACVLARPHLGGSQFVGAKKVMNVTVFGTDRAARLKGLGLGGGGLGVGRLRGGDFAM